MSELQSNFELGVLTGWVEQPSTDVHLHVHSPFEKIENRSAFPHSGSKGAHSGLYGLILVNGALASTHVVLTGPTTGAAKAYGRVDRNLPVLNAAVDYSDMLFAISAPAISFSTAEVHFRKSSSSGLSKLASQRKIQDWEFGNYLCYNRCFFGSTFDHNWLTSFGEMSEWNLFEGNLSASHILASAALRLDWESDISSAESPAQQGTTVSASEAEKIKQLLEMNAGRLPAAVSNALNRQLHTALDPEELAAEQISPSVESFKSLLRFYIDQQISRPPLLGINQEGVFGASWNNSNLSKLNIYFEGKEHARVSVVLDVTQEPLTIALSGRLSKLIQVLNSLNVLQWVRM